MLSVVIPLFNEEESLDAFYRELLKVLNTTYKSHEIIFVDDGSTDSSLKILNKFKAENKDVKVFSFRKNQGKAEALTLGFQKASGDRIATLDADLQDKPGEIKKLMDKMDNGFDFVNGWRKNRKDPLKKRISSKVFNYIISLWGVKLHDSNCGLKLYAKEAAKSLNLYGGMHRFIPLLLDQQGFKIAEVPVEHDIRAFGKSKYRFSKIWKDIPDLFTMLLLSKYNNRPMHLFWLIGSTSMFIGFLVLIYLTVLHFEGQGVGQRPALFLGILLVLSGLQIILTGFLADLTLNTRVDKNKDTLLK